MKFTSFIKGHRGTCTYFHVDSERTATSTVTVMVDPVTARTHRKTKPSKRKKKKQETTGLTVWPHGQLSNCGGITMAIKYEAQQNIHSVHNRQLAQGKRGKTTSPFSLYTWVRGKTKTTLV